MVLVSVVESMSLLTADVSTAFMCASVEADACDLVLCEGPTSHLVAEKGHEWLEKAPLLWFFFRGRSVTGDDETFESMFRAQTDVRPAYCQ